MTNTETHIHPNPSDAPTEFGVEVHANTTVDPTTVVTAFLTTEALVSHLNGTVILEVGPCSVHIATSPGGLKVFNIFDGTSGWSWNVRRVHDEVETEDGNICEVEFISAELTGF